MKTKFSSVSDELLSRYLDRGIDIRAREIRMRSFKTGEDEEDQMDIDATTVEQVREGLDILTSIEGSKEHKKDPITIFMNSEGGSIYDGFAIYDLINTATEEVVIDVYGKVMSAASVVLQAADRRCMSEHAILHFHHPTIEYQESRGLVALENQYRENRALVERMDNIFLKRIKEKHPEYAKEKLHAELMQERCLTAQEAVDFGLADVVIK